MASQFPSVDVEADSLVDYAEPLASQTPKRWTRMLGLVGVATGLVGLAGAVASNSSLLSRTRIEGMQGKDIVEVTPSDAACSAATDNCYWTGCCKVTGHKCYQKGHEMARCNETCTAGTCDVIKQRWEAVATYSPGTLLYCIAVYTADTGSSKKSTELELLTLQRTYDASIFGCEGNDVFSDVMVSLGKGTYTIKLEDTYNEFHQLKRKETGAWVNWAMFYQMWAKVRELGKFHHHDYTIKVDPDAVFIPARMRSYLTGKMDTEHGIYYENCKNVQMGFFGNTEVLTHQATTVLTDNLEDCHEAFGPCANDGCDWKFGAWGEDVFAQRCMDRHLVDKVQAFDLTTDGACQADRPEGEKKNKKWHAKDCSKVLTAAMHPFKKPKDYFKCLGEVMGREYQV